MGITLSPFYVVWVSAVKSCLLKMNEHGCGWNHWAVSSLTFKVYQQHTYTWPLCVDEHNDSSMASRL